MAEWRLLLVEDDLGDRKIVRRALRSVHAEVVEVATLGEAQARLAEGGFDCAIVDWNLPDGTASALLEAEAAYTQNTPIVILTGQNEQQLAKRALQAGAQDYLIKGQPFGGQDLARSIRFAIERQRAIELQTRLAHAERLASIGKIAAGVAHEVNNPATLILTNLTLLQERNAAAPHDGEDAETSKLLGESIAAMNRITSLIHHLSGFSRRLIQSSELLDLKELVHEGVHLAMPSIRHRAEIEIACEEVAPIVGDRDALTGVVVNLMLNAQQAIDAAPAGEHRIKVQLTSTSAGPCLKIEDTGPGVVKRNRSAIFQPFFSERKEMGTGLGLSICREAVEAHGGRIDVGDSELGGAAFCVILPWDTGLNAVPAMPASPEPALPPGLSFLVVDDDSIVRRSITRLLPEQSLEEVNSGREGMELFTAGRFFDVVLCDLMMPEQTGQQFYQQVVETFPNQARRFIFVTAGAVTPASHAFLAALDAPVVSKPFTAQDLISATHVMLKQL